MLWARCFALLSVVSVAVACTPTGDSVLPKGGLGEACNDDATCDRGLVCSALKCVPTYGYGDPTGDGGDHSSGDQSTGDGVVGDASSGDGSSGDGGDHSSGDQPTGDGVAGDASSGDSSSGDGVTGDASSGDAGGGATCLDGGSPRSAVSALSAQLVISELYANPNQPASDNDRDWLELYVASGAAVDLNGLLIENESSSTTLRSWTIDSANCISVTPGSYVVIGGVNAGLDSVSTTATITGISATLFFQNSARLSVKANGLLVDEITGMTVTSGKSYSLAPNQLDATANDLVSNWCVAPAQHAPFIGWGSPGAANDACL